jgi:hypothetical protein
MRPERIPVLNEKKFLSFYQKVNRFALHEAIGDKAFKKQYVVT